MTSARPDCLACEGTGTISSPGEGIIDYGRTCQCVREDLSRYLLAKRPAPKPIVVQREARPDSRDPFVLLREALATSAGRKMILSVLTELRAQLDAGFGEGSMRLAIETARRKRAGGAGGPGAYRLDNRVAPALARFLLRNRPQLRGWLVLRKMAGEAPEVTAAYNSKELPMPVDMRLAWCDPDSPMRPRD
jgi:hypothetical protein